MDCPHRPGYAREGQGHPNGRPTAGALLHQRLLEFDHLAGLGEGVGHPGLAPPGCDPKRSLRAVPQDNGPSFAAESLGDQIQPLVADLRRIGWRGDQLGQIAEECDSIFGIECYFGHHLRLGKGTLPGQAAEGMPVLEKETR